MKQENFTSQLLRFFGLVVLTISASSFADAATLPQSDEKASRTEIRYVEQIEKQITQAGELFQKERFAASAMAIGKVQSRIERLSQRATGEYRDLLQAQHQRMSKAHKLLTDKEQRLAAIQPFPAAQAEPGSSDGNVSFVGTVAPILNAKCGRCHVTQTRGQFSLKDYNTLMDSTHVTVGEPNVSHLIEVIEDGSMPKGGLKVSAAELESLKTWIAAGAPFDGEDKTQILSQLGPAAGDAAMPDAPARVTVQPPTGTETVSFAADVAPVLMQNCGRCHMTRNNRGNFNMAQFRTFIRGGDSGAPVKPGDSANSTLIRRLRGVGGDVMPPSGKLDDAVIAGIATWIDEGARFNPDDATLAMATLAAKGKAAGLSHDDLVVARTKEADRIWKLAMSDVIPKVTDTANFRLVGTPSDEGIDVIAKEVEALLPELQRVLKTTSKERFIRGNGTLFVLTRRYDFGEFGKMVQKRDFPRGLKAYWNHNTTIAYSVTMRSREQSMEQFRVLLARTLAATHIADLDPSVPRWFADGMGFYAAAQLFGKDEQVRAWEQDAVAAARSMQRPDDFLKGRLDEDKAGLVSYVFVRGLRSDKRRFGKLITSLLSGENFDKSFESIYGSSPEKFFDGYEY